MQHKIKLIEEAEKELIDNTLKCIVCMENKKNISFADGCDHVAVCSQCERKMANKQCPICKASYSKTKTLNI